MRVIDIAFDQPSKSDVLFVDTNVWLFKCYEKATWGLDKFRSRVVDQYIRYLGRASSLGSKLITYPTVLFEIARYVEREEYLTVCRSKGIEPYSRGFEVKVWRADPKAREITFTAMRDIWSEITRQGTVLAISLPIEICSEVFAEAERHSIDITDALHVQMMKACGITQILSDDIDFVDADSAFDLMTHNQTALSEAAQRNLLARR